VRYVSLHHHSTFSYLDGYGLPESHVRRAMELDMGTLALTEHGNISSHVQLEISASKVGIEPIFGCELYMAERPKVARKNHLTVLAATLEGYRNLLRLVSKGWDQFYYEPTVYEPDLWALREGLVVLSGCTGSLLATSLVGGKNIHESEASYAAARRIATRYRNILGDAYYLEVQAFPTLEKVRQINVAYARMSEELGIPLVATGDVHYTRPSENEMQMILHNVRGGNKQTLEDMARSWGYDVPLSPPTNDVEMIKRLVATGLTRKQAERAVLNTEEIAMRCGFELPKLDRVRFPLPHGFTDTQQVWESWLSDGWKFRGIPLRANPGDYVRQLRKEVAITKEKDFIDYFLIVSDIVKFAKDSGIPVGPGRGSAAASLVCYLLRITEVDPLLYPTLLFERFIDVTRADLPDIDLDFDDERRGEVYDYAVAKYGAQCVGSIGTFTKYKSKNSLDDVARVYRIPGYEVETVKGLLLERSSGDLRASATIEDTAAMFPQAAAVFDKYPDLRKSTKLEGNMKGMGVHAAGLVIANGPLTDVCATYTRVVAGQVRSVISADKYDAEHLNILKIDVLGLSTMGMIRLCLEMIGKPLGWLYEIPLDDPEVIRGFRENDVVGIFQYDGRAMRSVNAEIKPDNFMEVADVTALARPGPLHNNATSEYVDAKHGRKPARRLHPMLDTICGATHYQIVYQEQILRIVREIGNFDWTHAAYIRKIISRKIGEQEFNRQWERFWEGAQANGLDEETAKAIWGQCITAGSYAFNVAHSISYGMLAWWTMYLKQHHPLEFYVASLNKYNDKGKQHELLRDALRHEITILPPHPAKSGASFSSEGSSIRCGFSQIPGLGGSKAAAIMEYRKVHSLGEWKELDKIKGFGRKTVANVEAFCASDDPLEITKLDRVLAAVRHEIRHGSLRRRLPFPTHTSLQVPYQRVESDGDSKPPDTPVVWLGVVTHRNLRELFEVNFSRTGVPLDPDTVRDPHLNEWVIMLGRDEGELLTITIDRWKYPRFREAVWGIRLDHDVVVVRGVKKGYQSRRSIYVHDMWVLDPDGNKEEENV
jgi:DNA polymerase III subunit alpha